MEDSPTTTPVEDIPSPTSIDGSPTTAPMEHSHLPVPMPSYDVRQQIIANALVIFPQIVDKHVKKFSSFPVRAEDMFDVCILAVDSTDPDAHPNTNPAGSFRAMLTHTDGAVFALRTLLISTQSMPTAESALDTLLEAVATVLGTNRRTFLPKPEGVFTIPNATDLEAYSHGNMIYEAVKFAKNAAESKRTTTPKALWKKCKKAMHGGQAR